MLEQDNCLYYYKHAKDKEPCGVIVLCNYSVSKAPEVNKRHCMKLTKGGARTYYMCAGSEDERKQWMVALMDAVKDSAVDVIFPPFCFILDQPVVINRGFHASNR